MFLILPELWYQCIIIAMAFGIGVLAYMVLVPAKPRGAVTCLTPTACDVDDNVRLFAALPVGPPPVIIPPINRPEVDADWLPRIQPHECWRIHPGMPNCTLGHTDE